MNPDAVADLAAIMNEPPKVRAALLKARESRKEGILGVRAHDIMATLTNEQIAAIRRGGDVDI